MDNSNSSRGINSAMVTVPPSSVTAAAAASGGSKSQSIANGTMPITTNSTTNAVHDSGGTSSLILLGLTSVICISIVILVLYYLYLRLRHGGRIRYVHGRRRPLKLESCRYTHLDQTEPLDDDLSCDEEPNPHRGRGVPEPDLTASAHTHSQGTRKYAQQTEYKTATLVVDSTGSDDHVNGSTNSSVGALGENYWLLTGGVGGFSTQRDDGALQSDEDLLQ